jgi:hypothetical protein
MKKLTKRERIGMMRSAFAAGLGANPTDPSTDAQHEWADALGSRVLKQLRDDRKRGEEWTRAIYFQKERSE